MLHPKIKLHLPGKSALTVLRVGLPLYVLELVSFMIWYLDARSQNPLGAADRASSAMEYVLASLLAVLASAFLADLLEHDLK